MYWWRSPGNKPWMLVYRYVYKSSSCSTEKTRSWETLTMLAIERMLRFWFSATINKILYLISDLCWKRSLPRLTEGIGRTLPVDLIWWSNLRREIGNRMALARIPLCTHYSSSIRVISTCSQDEVCITVFFDSVFHDIAHSVTFWEMTCKYSETSSFITLPMLWQYVHHLPPILLSCMQCKYVNILGSQHMVRT